MASLVLNGNTSGSITISSPAVSGSNTLTLPNNTGTVLTTASTFGGTGPAFKVYNNATQSISSAVATKVIFQVEEFDTNSNFDITTNYRFTPTVAGYYQITASMRLNVVSSRTYAIAMIYKNGSLHSRVAIYGTSNALFSQTSSLVYCNGTTDYVEMYGQSDGTSPTVDYGGVGETYFCGVLVRGA
jgi:hypothetical protein